ncbi:MAG: DNA polymerase III subunit delta [Desulfovibrio sp.]|jgi:DNA polymerase-3 subunit delta|nr:DNA polymerase III subunit delta [Desulfovibrio sp.]
MSLKARPGFSFLICPDSLLLKSRLEAQTAEFFPLDKPWERHVHWGDEEPGKAFWDQLTLQDMFGKPRAVIVRQAQQWPAAVWKLLSKILARPSPLCLPFFCLEASDKGKPKIPTHIAKLPCFEFAGKQGWIWRQDGLNERGVKRHVQLRAKELRLRFQPDALDQFCACLPPEALVIENELRKLVLLSRAGEASGADGVISAAMTVLCASGAECNIFALLRHIEAGDLPSALREAARNQENEESLFFPLLTLLAKNMRILWRLKSGERVQLFPSEADARERLADRLDFSTLAQCVGLIMDAEWQVKSGRCEVEQSLNFLLAELTNAFRA